MRKNSEKIDGRNHGIDFLRGLCILGVLWHHSCLYLGMDFLPMFIKHLSFLLEVPAIFFVSGMTMRFINRDMITNGLLKLSLSFTLIYLILNILCGNWNVCLFWQPLLFQTISLPPFFNVLSSSYWFVPAYVSVILCGNVIVKKIQPVYPIVMVGCFLLYILVFFNFITWRDFHINFLNNWSKGLFFLLGFFLLGYWWMDHKELHVSRYKYALILLLVVVNLICVMYCYSGNKIFELWRGKEIQDLSYVVASMLSIIVFICLYRDNLSNRFLERIGKYSLFYFIGQGISTSLLKIVVPYISLPYFLKILVLYGLNIIVLFGCAELFMFIYQSIGRFYKKMFSYAIK